MEHRIQIDQIAPEAYKGMFALEQFLQNSNLHKTHLELIKIRASQLNGCAFCIDMHSKAALENGEKKERIFLLNAWRDADLFSTEEKLILQITEEVTMIHQNGLTDATYQQVIKLFGEAYFAQIIMAICTINAWNRIAVSTKKPIVD